MRQYLLVAVSIVLTSSLASAGPSSAPDAVALVTDGLIKPLAKKEQQQSKFSRARLPPAERRVRVLDEALQHDHASHAFVTFAVDARRGWGKPGAEASWDKATITGCVYPSSGEVFIKRGSAYHPAIAATGKKTKAAASGTCQAAAQLTAR